MSTVSSTIDSEGSSSTLAISSPVPSSSTPCKTGVSSNVSAWLEISPNDRSLVFLLSVDSSW
ncbi:hypothetical protein X975_06935, partial [Stegodyphus mimosarum]